MSQMTHDDMAQFLRLRHHSSTPEEESVAIQHAEREWNPMRTVPVAGRDFGAISGTLSVGGLPVAIGARDTRVYLIIQNLSATDYLIVSKSQVNTAQNGTAPISSGADFPIPPNKTLSIPSRGACFLCCPSDASAPIQFSVMDVYD